MLRRAAQIKEIPAVNRAHCSPLKFVTNYRKLARESALLRSDLSSWRVTSDTTFRREIELLEKKAAEIKKYKLSDIEIKELNEIETHCENIKDERVMGNKFINDLADHAKSFCDEKSANEIIAKYNSSEYLKANLDSIEYSTYGLAFYGALFPTIAACVLLFGN